MWHIVETAFAFPPGGRPHPDPVGEVPVIDDLRPLPDLGVDRDVARRIGPSTNGTASPVGEPTELVAQLRTALATNRRIGMAMGIVIRELDVDEEEAFAVLRRLSQETNCKLHDVADDIVRRRRR